MAIEIERKFLLVDDSWRRQVTESHRIAQGYLSRGAESSVRVRIADGAATLNIKSSRDGIQRLEFEYPIPLADAEQMLAKVARAGVIDKTRYLVPLGEHLWEIDEFHGENAGLIVAEIELRRVDESFQRPDWLGREVSDDPRYYNSSLSEKPYARW